MESISARHGDGVLKDFSALMSERALPIDIISKVVILAEGALWKHRTIRDSTTTTTTSPITIESSIAGHVLGLHRVLLQVGLTQLNESPPQDAEENDLAQRITAKFRRMLPALRIAGKWLRANFKYVQQAQKEEKKSSSVLVIAGLPLFWQAYAQFTTELYRSFPADRLPSLISSLEEDIDMRGFLPLRKLMGGGDADSISEAGSGTKIAAQVHPNEEQLMRIKDLLEDAKALAGFEVRVYLHFHFMILIESWLARIRLFCFKATAMLQEQLDHSFKPLVFHTSAKSITLLTLLPRVYGTSTYL